MARVQLPFTILDATGAPVNGAALAITHRASGSPAVWYTAETGGTGSSASVITDANGRASAWLDRGAYNVQVSGTGITTYTRAWDATPGKDAGIDEPWIDPLALAHPYIRGTGSGVVVGGAGYTALPIAVSGFNDAATLSIAGNQITANVEGVYIITMLGFAPALTADRLDMELRINGVAMLNAGSSTHGSSGSPKPSTSVVRSLFASDDITVYARVGASGGSPTVSHETSVVRIA
jgi:hypothetical protein